MTDSGFTVCIAETRTGNVAYPDVPYLGIPQFARRINDDSSISIDIPVGDPGVPAVAKLRAITTPWRYSIAILSGKTVLAYGPIMTYQFDQASQVLKLGAGSMWALFSRRLLLNPAATIASPLSMDPAQDANYTGWTLATIMKKLASDSVGRGAGYELPIDFPADVASTNVRNYPIYDLASVGQRMKDLTQVEQGPDVDWDPYLATANTIRVLMRIGTPSLTQAGVNLIWHDGSSLTYVNVDSTSANMTTSVYTRGNSTERASQVAYATDTSLIGVGWPILESVDTTHQSVTDFTTLQGYANEWVRYYKNPVETWSAEVVMDVSPVVGTYKPGDTAIFNVQNHPWIPAGRYNQRILGWQQSGVNRLGLILEAREGAV
jgi:hypothetical protein